MRLIDSCITQLKAQGPSRTCSESKEEDKEEEVDSEVDLPSVCKARCIPGSKARCIPGSCPAPAHCPYDSLTGRGNTSTEHAQGTPVQSHILVYEDKLSVGNALGKSASKSWRIAPSNHALDCSAHISALPLCTPSTTFLLCLCLCALTTLVLALTIRSWRGPSTPTVQGYSLIRNSPPP